MSNAKNSNWEREADLRSRLIETAPSRSFFLLIVHSNRCAHFLAESSASNWDTTVAAQQKSIHSVPSGFLFRYANFNLVVTRVVRTYRVERKVCHRWILHLRFGGNICKEPVEKLTLILNFFFAFYSSRRRNLIVVLKNGKKISYSFNTANACVLTATLWYWTRGCLFYVILGFTQYLIYHSCSISVNLNNQMIKLTVLLFEI